MGVSEDELQNVDLVEEAALAAVRERKRKANAQYTGYDDEEFDEDRIGKKAEILSKYDDDYASGKGKSDGFRLGAPVEKKEEVDDEDSEMITLGQAPATKVRLNLDFTSEFLRYRLAQAANVRSEDFEVSDYMKEGDAGFKQRKVGQVWRLFRAVLMASAEKEVKEVWTSGRRGRRRGDGS